MGGLDWAIVAVVFLFIAGGVLVARRWMRSVADFLAAGRTAGRYLLSVSGTIAGVGAITIVGNLQMNYQAGFAMSWWGMSMGIVVLLAAVSGFVIYRFRATRCLTLAEFFERRYSRRFRIFAGLVAFVAGLVNFGIFPAVGARFFIYFTGLPERFELLGHTLSTFPVLMAGLLAVSLWFVFLGGQVAVIVTDFLQGIFANVVFVLIPLYLLFVVGWERVAEVLGDQPAGQSRINPFDTGYVEDFNVWYFLIGVVGFLYSRMAWQGEQAYNVSAKSAHEAKMGGVLSLWRNAPRDLLMLLVPILAATVMQHPDFAGIAADVNGTLEGIQNEAIRQELPTPLVLTKLLPPGLMGLFCALMLVAFISTHDTYLHSWGAIFIQDVIMPFRKKPFGKEQHIRVLRWAILGVAVFAFLFSWLYVPAQQILLYFAITGAIFAGGSGAVIIGGLYWKRGTTGAAWTAMLTGSTIAVGGLLLRHFDSDHPINGQEYWGLGMAASVLVYVVVSLAVRPRVFDLPALLDRGRAEREVVAERPSRWALVFGMGKEFTRRDKLLYVVTYGWTFVNIGVFLVGTIVNLTRDVADTAWLTYWLVYVGVQVAIACTVIVWFAVGGVRDLRRMARALTTMGRDDSDDGMVRHEA